MYFLDSCACIDFMRGKIPSGYQFLRESDPRLFGIPTVVEAELLLGAAKSAVPEKNRKLVESFLLPFEVIPFDSKCSRVYARIRAQLEQEGKTIGPNDLLIAATALAHEAILVTSNEREFKRVPGLELEVWEEVDYNGASSSC